MKKLELKTSKGEFIIEEASDKNLGRFLVKHMIEEQFAEVVDSFELFGNINVGYKNYTEEEPVLDTAKQSFESLIKSLGWYLFENPLDSTKYLFEEGKDQNKFFVRLPKRRWQEAESKTLYNPVLLKKV